MDKFKGTPGPWTGKDVGVCNQDRVGLQLGFIMSFDDERVAECTANAQLIGSAPELLEALQELFAHYKELADSGDAGNWKLEDEPVGKKAMAAIDKALGK